MELDKKTVRKIQGLVLFTAAVAVCCFKTEAVLKIFRYILGILYPFLMGGAMAFVINILMKFLENRIFENKWTGKSQALRRIKRPVSLLLAFLIIISAFLSVFFLVIPELVEAVVQMGSHLQGSIQNIYNLLEEFFYQKDWSEALLSPLEAASHIDWPTVVEKSLAFLSGGIGSILGSTFSVASVVIGQTFNWLIAIVFACYLLIGKEKLGGQGRRILKAYLPERWNRRALELLGLTGRTFASFITGQCLEAMLLGVMFFVAMTVGKFPYALVISVLIGFMALIPYVGAFLGCAVGILMIFTVSPVKALVFLVLFNVLQQIEGNVIYPRVVGKSVGLPAAWVLVAITLGGSLMGIVGMLVFIPVVSVGYTLLLRDVDRRLAEERPETSGEEAGNGEEK